MDTQRALDREVLLKIDSLSITHVKVPMIEPFRISSGEVSEKEAIIVALRAAGLTGYGESSPMSGSFYSADTPEKSWQELCGTVGPAIVGRSFAGSDDWARTLDVLPAGNFTKTGVETALWDLAAQIQGEPLARFLGGTRTQVESGLAVGLYENSVDMLRTIEKYLVDGYRRVKIKIEPGRDIELVRAVRNTFGDIPLYVDANGAYSIRDAAIFHALDDFHLMMFEQPFPGPALEDLAQLQKQVRTPICLDESLETVDHLRYAIALDSFRIANFKIQRVGGFQRALEMYRICREHDIPAWVGTMPELGIGQAQGAALAALDGFVYPTDVEASDRWFCDDIIEPWIRVRNGLIDLPTCPGLGYSISNTKLSQYATASRTFSA
jgi:O-succinylbenzoate synthase